jgi:hypothetical protein
LCSQHKPRIRHREQGTLRFEIIETLDNSKASLGVSPIPFYQLRHASDPRPLKRCIAASTVVKKIRSVLRHFAPRDGQTVKTRRLVALC